MSKYLILLTFLYGCNLDYKYSDHLIIEVKCEKPYFSGTVDQAYSSKEGTFIKTKDGVDLRYPPSVKCEIKTTVKVD